MHKHRLRSIYNNNHYIRVRLKLLQVMRSTSRFLLNASFVPAIIKYIRSRDRHENRLPTDVVDFINYYSNYKTSPDTPEFIQMRWKQWLSEKNEQQDIFHSFGFPPKSTFNVLPPVKKAKSDSSELVVDADIIPNVIHPDLEMMRTVRKNLTEISLRQMEFGVSKQFIDTQKYKPASPCGEKPTLRPVYFGNSGMGRGHHSAAEYLKWLSKITEGVNKFKLADWEYEDETQVYYFKTDGNVCMERCEGDCTEQDDIMKTRIGSKKCSKCKHCVDINYYMGWIICDDTTNPINIKKEK